MRQRENPITEKDLRNWLRTAGSSFPPVTFRLIGESDKPPVRVRDQDIDAFIDIAWTDQRFRFATELKSLSTPMAIQAAIDHAKRGAQAVEMLPLIVVPFLSEENLLRLEQAEVSGLDLCGNGLIQVPGKLLVRKSGAPNRFRGAGVIQNVYRGSSSLVARAFLLKSRYESTGALLAELRSRGASVTLPTVSKVCSTLAEDLIIERQRQRQSTELRLLQPEKLLDALGKNYVKAAVRDSLLGSSELQDQALLKKLQAWQTERGESIVRTGADSTERYATMAREPVRRYYCTNLSSLMEFLGTNVIPGARFPTVEFLETTDATVYFDVRASLLASPLQCYLELQGGDKRDQQTAAEVRQRCLSLIDRRGDDA